MSRGILAVLFSKFPLFETVDFELFSDSPNSVEMARITLPFAQNQKGGFPRYELEKLHQTHHFVLGQADFTQA